MIDRNDLLKLIKDTEPYYTAFDSMLLQRCGSYSVDYDTWIWDSKELEKLTDDQIVTILEICNDSWNIR